MHNGNLANVSMIVVGGVLPFILMAAARVIAPAKEKSLTKALPNRAFIIKQL